MIIDEEVEEENKWHSQLTTFLRDGEILEELTKSTKRAFKVRAMRYCFMGYVL